MVPQFHTRLAITPYRKGHWFLTEPLIYTTLVLGFPWRIYVPETDRRGGWSSDLSSIPLLIQPIIRKSADTHAPGVLHDYLCYRNPHHHDKGKDGIDRGIADRVFLEALLVNGVNPIKARIMYTAVRAVSLTKR